MLRRTGILVPCLILMTTVGAGGSCCSSFRVMGAMDMMGVLSSIFLPAILVWHVQPLRRNLGKCLAIFVRFLVTDPLSHSVLQILRNEVVVALEATFIGPLPVHVPLVPDQFPDLHFVQVAVLGLLHELRHTRPSELRLRLSSTYFSHDLGVMY